MMSDTFKIIGNHPEMRNVRRRIRRVAPTDLNVIIYGEAGTEKVLVAREILRKSLCDQNIFELLDCFRLLERETRSNENIMENTFDAARGGTLFLDNIEAIPQTVQRRLYHLLTEKPDRAVSPALRKARAVRIIAASTDMDYVENNGFSRQLALLISQYAIKLVPLRKRKGDIPLLFDYYYTLAAELRGYKEKPAVSEEIFQSIMEYDWKGNIDEMRSTIDALLNMSPKDRLTAEALPFVVPAKPMSFLEEFDYHTALAKVDEYLIRRALERFGWNQTRAAHYLNMTEGNIRLKIRKYAIKKEN